MTWKQFKDFVESRGVKDEDQIHYIDVSYLEESHLSIRLPTETDGFSVH
jgi:hypothetical protein